MRTYGKLLEAGHESSSLPSAIGDLIKMSRFITWVLNGGNGFLKYQEEEGWDAETVNQALQTMRAIGLEDVADRFAPYVERLNEPTADKNSRNQLFETVFSAFYDKDLKQIEDKWYSFDYGENTRRYLMQKLSYEVLPREDHEQRLQALTASNGFTQDKAIEELKEFANTDVRPVNMLADLVIQFLDGSSVTLTTPPKLQQFLHSPSHAYGSGTSPEFAFDLVHTSGKRRVSLRMSDDIELVISDLDPSNDEILEECFKSQFDLEDQTASVKMIKQAKAVFQAVA
ncbi:MAG: hypothetical protein ABJN26_16005 [Stappiaceae bacterium]